MATKTCFKCCCEVLVDPFTRADDTDIGSNWDEVEAGAAIVSNRLRMTSAGCLVVSTAEGGGNSFYVEVVLRSSTEGIHARVIVDRVDADNFHFLDVHFRHTGDTTTLQLYDCAAGVETAIGAAQTTDAFEVGDPLYLRVCLGTDGRLVGSVSIFGFGPGNLLSACLAETTVKGGTKIALNLVDAATIDWDDVEWQKHKTETSTCPECNLGCASCLGGDPPQQYLITLAGFADDVCTDCDVLNGAYVVTLSCPAEAACFWIGELPADACFSDGGDVGCPSANGDSTGIPRLIYLWLFANGTDLEVFVTLQNSGSVLLTFVQIIEAFDGDCELDIDDFTVNTNTLPCDLTTATVRVQSLPL